MVDIPDITQLPVIDSALPQAGQLLARGVRRAFADLGLSALTEVPLPNGRRADVLALDGAGQLLLVEVKSCVADFRADGKWPDYLAYCDLFYFAVPAEFPRTLLPEGPGIIVADAYGAVIERESEGSALAPARRRALLLRFAHLAAGRLQILQDPAAERPR